jgi:hypothetical protein
VFIKLHLEEIETQNEAEKNNIYLLITNGTLGSKLASTSARGASNPAPTVPRNI